MPLIIIIIIIIIMSHDMLIMLKLSHHVQLLKTVGTISNLAVVNILRVSSVLTVA